MRRVTRHWCYLLSAQLTWAISGAARADHLLADFDYPHPVQRYEFRSQGQSLTMAYMDVRPAQPNGKAVVLLHGKNFCGATWEDAIGALRDAGYRVGRARPDRLLQIDEAAGLPVRTSPACRQYARAPWQASASSARLLSVTRWAACWRCVTRSCTRAR